MRILFRKLLFLAGVFLGLAIFYIPFRLLAQQFNNVFPGNSDNFCYRFSILLWPTYAFLCGFMPMFAAKRSLVRWFNFLFVFIIAFLLWDQITVLDDWFNIPDRGLFGFRSYPTNHPGMNTPHLSVILCPFMFLGGSVVGTIVGWLRLKQTEKKEHPEL